MEKSELNKLEEQYELENVGKENLRKLGYYVERLWKYSDVQDIYECDKDTSFHILDRAITENIMTIRKRIDSLAQELKLKKKNNEE
tara:strand:- start:2035 stop:2292 length:258 start_codon:yes stop_codon:yes gene_type:complete